MDRKRGKYVVNIEDSGNQPVSIDGITVVCSDSSQSCFQQEYNFIFLLQPSSSPKGILNQNAT